MVVNGAYAHLAWSAPIMLANQVDVDPQAFARCGVNHMLCASALTVPQGNQCLRDLGHLLISARASSPTVSLPVGRVLLTWHAMLIGPGFAQSIRAFGPTADNYRGYLSASGHCFGQLFCIVTSSASGDDSTHIFSFFAL